MGESGDFGPWFLLNKLVDRAGFGLEKLECRVPGIPAGAEFRFWARFFMDDDPYLCHPDHSTLE